MNQTLKNEQRLIVLAGKYWQRQDIPHPTAQPAF